MMEYDFWSEDELLFIRSIFFDKRCEIEYELDLIEDFIDEIDTYLETKK